MPNTRDEKTSAYPSILVIGENGTHKTYFIGTAPKPFLFDFDKTKRVLQGKDVEFAVFRDAPYGSKIVRPELGIFSYGDAYPRFLDKINEIGKLMEKGTCPWETLALDSLTFFGNIALNHVLKNSTANNAEAMRKGSGSIDPGTWGQQMRLIETVLDQFTSWDVIKIVSAHVQKDENTVLGTMEKLPYVTGKLAGKIGAYFDEICYAETEGKAPDQKFVFRTSKDTILRQAKSPSGVPDRSPIEWKAVEKYLFAAGAV